VRRGRSVEATADAGVGLLDGRPSTGSNTSCSSPAAGVAGGSWPAKMVGEEEEESADDAAVEVEKREICKSLA
jgi:hypothetical protein